MYTEFQDYAYYFGDPFEPEPPVVPCPTPDETDEVESGEDEYLQHIFFTC